MVKFVLVLGFIILALYGYSIIISAKFFSPYKVYVIFGKKGVGKSADIVKRALRYQKLGYRTFCSEKDVSICEYFDPEDFGKFSCPKSVIFLDEAGVVFHKRDFADKSKSSMLKTARIFVKWSRHEEMIVFIYSQSWDIDFSLKEAADFLYYYRKFFNVFTVGRRINKSIVLTDPDADRPGAMADSYAFDSIFSRGSVVINYIPKYAKYYSSYKKLGLPSYEKLYGLPEVKEAERAPDDAGADGLDDMEVEKK